MSVTAEYKEIMVIPMGQYAARLNTVEEGEPSQYGPVWRWAFEILDPQYANVQLMGISSHAFSNKSKAYRWAVGLGHPTRTPFNSTLIEGRQCQLAIAVETDDDGDSFNRIHGVLPPDPNQAEVVSAQPVPSPLPE